MFRERSISVLLVELNYYYGSLPGNNNKTGLPYQDGPLVMCIRAICR